MPTARVDTGIVAVGHTIGFEMFFECLDIISTKRGVSALHRIDGLSRPIGQPQILLREVHLYIPVTHERDVAGIIPRRLAKRQILGVLTQTHDIRVEAAQMLHIVRDAVDVMQPKLHCLFFFSGCSCIAQSAFSPTPGAFSNMQFFVGGSPHTDLSCRNPTHSPVLIDR